MAKGAPDHILLTQVVVVVENVPFPTLAANNYPVPTYGVKSTLSSEYQTVKEIEVTKNRVGILRTIEIATDNYAVAQWKLVIAEVEIFADKKFPDSFTKELPDLEMSAGQKATLYVKSDGTTTINAYCDFGYKEVG